MKKIITLIIFIFLTIGLFSQPWLKNLPQKTKSELTFFDYQKAFEEYWKPFNLKNGYYLEDGVKKKAAGWKQFKRWEFSMEGLINPENGHFPKKTAQQVLSEFKKDNIINKNYKSSDWSVLGPNSSGGGYAGIGRVSCIAFHPSDNNTYWIGVGAGGLWKTTDNGSSWTCLTDNNAVLAVSDIVIPSDYVTSNTIYIATGDKDAWDNNSVGVLKTTDGGTTWNTTGLTYSIADGDMVTRLIIDPNNNQSIIAATTNGIYKTTNGGSTWDTMLSSISFIDMESKPGDFSTIYASTKNGYIYVSTDDGSSWVSSTDYGNRIELAVTPANSAIVYAIVVADDRGLEEILKSTNSGTSFSTVYNGDNLMGWHSDASDAGGQGSYDLSLAVSPTNADEVIMGGVISHKSIDGGVSWNCANCWTSSSTYNTGGHPVVHADKHQLKYRSNGDLFECNDGGIYFSDNNGTSFTDKSNGLIISQMYKLGVSQIVSSEVITGLQDNGTKLVSGGTWYDVKGGDGMECLIDYTDVNIQYGTYVRGQITRTTDRWVSDYTDIEPDAAGDGAWVTPYIIDPIDHNTLYAGYADVYKTTNKGDSWNKISTMNSSDKLRSMAISSDASTLYVADYRQIWKTTNGGTSWTDITGTLPVSTSYIRYISVKDDNPNTLWVSTSSYNTPGVYESVDGGATWTNISSGLPTIPVWTVIQNKQSSEEVHLYAGTEVGIYLKKGTDDWVEYNAKLPNVRIGELEIYYASNSADSKLRAATYGRGLWETPLAEINMNTASVTTSTPSEITINSAKLGGNVTSEGADNITERGIVWGESVNPTVSDNKVKDTNVGLGEYSTSVSGLSSATNYNVRAYAINTYGTSYGANKSFSTLCENLSIPYSENFNSGDGCWDGTEGTSNWENILPTITHDGNCFMTNGNSNYSNNSYILTSPEIDMTGHSNCIVSFYMWMEVEDPTGSDYWDGGFIECYNGTSWIKMTNSELSVDYDGTLTSSSGNPYANEEAYSTDKDWIQVKINLPSSFNNISNFKIRYKFGADGASFGKGWAIDDVLINESTTSIYNIVSEQIMIFPNPTNGIFNIEFEKNIINANISISNITGKVIYTNNLSSSLKHEVDLSSYSKGIYFIKFNLKDETLIYKLVIK